MIYQIQARRDAPASVDYPAPAGDPLHLFSYPAPDSIDRSPVNPNDYNFHLFGTTAPADEGTLDAKLMFDADPSIIVGRQAVGANVVQLPPRTVSAGNESVKDVRRFDLPLMRNGWAYRLLRGPMRSTMLAPELQSELDDAGAGNVMPVKRMNPAVQVLAPAPWYETYSKTIGR